MYWKLSWKTKKVTFPSKCPSAQNFRENLMNNCYEILDPKISHSLRAQKFTFILCHQVQFQKSLKSGCREYFKYIYCGSKKDLFPNFEHNINFPSKSKTFNFTHSLLEVIRYDFRKKLISRFRKKLSIFGPKMPHLPHFGYTKRFP